MVLINRGKNRPFLDAMSLGAMFPIAIGLGYLWGYWMDRMFGTRPWLTIVFTGYGIIAAFVNLYRLAKDAGSSDDEPPS